MSESESFVFEKWKKQIWFILPSNNNCLDINQLMKHLIKNLLADRGIKVPYIMSSV
jgi:hypothetical protein